MFDMKMMKSDFFDTPKVKRAVDKATRKVPVEVRCICPHRRPLVHPPTQKGFYSWFTTQQPYG